MKLDRLCVSRSATSFSGVVEISWPAYAGGPLHTHTQIQHLHKPFSRKRNCKQQEEESRWKKHHGCESQNPEATSEAGWLWRRQAGRMCICSRKSSQLYACTSRKSIDLGWALGRSFFWWGWWRTGIGWPELVDATSLETFKVRFDRAFRHLISLKISLPLAGELDWMTFKGLMQIQIQTIL